MIEYIKGELTDLTPALATVEAGGVGYGLNISLNTFSAIQGKKEVKLYVYEAIREDAYVLYGFINKKEREMFLLLITVNGVGANTARMMLSGMSVSELCKTSWNIIIHVHAPKKVAVLQDQVAHLILESIGDVAINKILEFYYYSQDDRYSKFNDSYPRFIASDNLVDVANEDYEDMEEGEGEDEIFTGDIFQNFNND